jgi:excisionase family DNA binding protein
MRNAAIADDPKGLNAQISPMARRIPNACRALDISRSHLYDLAAQGKIRLIKIGNRTLVPEAEIRRLATEGA